MTAPGSRPPADAAPDDAVAHALVAASADPRVAAAVAAVRGFPVSLLADERGVPEETVRRWTAGFLQGGAERVAGTLPADPSGVEGRLLDLVLREARALTTVARDVPEAAAGALHALDALLAEVGEAADLALGRLPLAVAPVDLRALVADVLAHAAAAAPGLPAPRLLPGPPVTAVVDAARLAGALLAVVQLAAREARGGAVLVRVVGGGGPGGGTAEVAVEQPGALSPARAHRLLEPFGLEGVPGAAPPPGLGLGLWLARGVAVAHGGLLALDLEDDGAARRTCYRTRLPLAGPAPGPLVERRSAVRYTLACGDVMPGCPARFEATGEDELLALVVPHARDAHGIAEVTPEVAAAVRGAVVVLPD